ncbi:MAG TPA: alfa-L-rhamnosidase, partial [Verrucomicrobiae bacterium]|nr:alfa-L-rhamnosidase [Verrucomicrobiae bacterium]
MRHVKLVSSLALFFLLFARIGIHAALGVGELRCEHLIDPLGIDATQPRLSWMLESDKRDVTQSAFQIFVASSEKKLGQNTGDLWDSGKVASRETIQIPYAGKELKSLQQVFWKVRVWDANEKPSPWSK